MRLRPWATSRQDRWVPIILIVLVSGYITVTLWAIDATSYDVWGGLLVLPVLVAISLPVLRWVARHDASLSERLLVGALFAKMVSTLVRYWQLYGVYEGGADSERYHDAGKAVSNALHSGLAWEVKGPFPGTAFIEGFTGYAYWIIGPSRVGGFFFYSWLGFWGLLLFQRAFRTALPQGDGRRYALLVLFLPSLLFWPSSIGKEAWMTLCLGLGTYGAARLLARQRGGLLALALGLGGITLVRPHMAAILLAALFVGYLARPYSRRSAYGPLAKCLGVIVLVVVGTLLVARAERFFGVEGSSQASLTTLLDDTAARTQQGGSSFDAEPVKSPLQLPAATVAVLLRPYPWEANNVQSFASSLESLLLLGLMWQRRRSLTRLPHLLRREPYVALAVTYTLLFVTAFSSFANFGILTRQRVQVFPFVLILLALPQVAAKAKRVPFVPARVGLVDAATQGERAIR